MKKSFRDNTVFVWLGFGLEYDDTTLVNCALNYLEENHKNVIQDSLIDPEEWQQFNRNYPELFEKMKEVLYPILKMD